MQLMLMSGEAIRRHTLSDDTGDDGLVRAAAEGDRGAFGELYVRYARMVHGILLARVPPQEAEDLVQEVFLSAMKQLRDLRTAAAFRGWLGTIARNRAMDHHRRARETTPIELVDPPAPRGAAQDAFLVLDQIRRLPEAYRETLILRLVEGMTGPEIAAQTGLTHESVRVNLCRGMKMLRELLETK
jgi:RNA polymerase sigma-70 factor (ECF subfamily)